MANQETLVNLFLEYSECQNLEKFPSLFDKGLNINQLFMGEPLVYAHINMYSRGPKFSQILKIFLDNGLEFEDKALLAVLMNDVIEIKKHVNVSHSNEFYSLKSAFTPLSNVSLLHIAVEYGHVEACKTLLELGFDVNFPSKIDDNGLGGHTPIFHAINQNQNFNFQHT